MEIVSREKVRGLLIKQVAEEHSLPIDTIDEIISFQFKDANAALKTSQQVEISKFGKFMISQSKLKRRVESFHRIIKGLEKKDISEYTSRKKESHFRQIQAAKDKLKFLQEKLRYEG